MKYIPHEKILELKELFAKVNDTSQKWKLIYELYKRYILGCNDEDIIDCQLIFTDKDADLADYMKEIKTRNCYDSSALAFRLIVTVKNGDRHYLRFHLEYSTGTNSPHIYCWFETCVNSNIETLCKLSYPPYMTYYKDVDYKYLEEMLKDIREPNNKFTKHIWLKEAKARTEAYLKEQAEALESRQAMRDFMSILDGDKKDDEDCPIALQPNVPAVASDDYDSDDDIKLEVDDTCTEKESFLDKIKKIFL